MRWLYRPDPMNVFSGGAGHCTQYQPCDCYCSPKLVKLMIWGEPIPWP
jgi:hypothetical protein